MLQSSACLIVFPLRGGFCCSLFCFIIKNNNSLCIWVLDLISPDRTDQPQWGLSRGGNRQPGIQGVRFPTSTRETKPLRFMPGGRWESYALDPGLPVAPSAESSCGWSVLSQEMRSRTQMQRLSGFFNNKIKQRTKTTPKGKNKQAGRQTDRRLEHSQMWNTHTTLDIRKTTDQHRTADTRRTI